VLELRDGTRKSWQALVTHTGLHITHTKWLVQSWSTLGARTSHGQHGHTRLTTARTWGKPPLPPYNILCDSPRSPHPNGYFSQDSRVGVLKSRQMGLPGLWSPITLRADLQSRCNLKQSCSSHREPSNAVSHFQIGHREEVDSRLFVVGSQIGNSIPGPSFGHNLCFRYPNEQCKPILDIYAPRAFQWYKERHKLLRFDPCNRSLKFQKSTGIPSPKVGFALGVWMFTPSHSLTLSNNPGSMWCDTRASSCLNSRASSWPALLAMPLPWLLGFLPLGPQPCNPLSLGREPKARVATAAIQHSTWSQPLLQNWNSRMQLVVWFLLFFIYPG